MSFATRASAGAARLVSHFSGGNTVTIKSLGGTYAAATRTLTSSSTSQTVTCSHPVPYSLSSPTGGVLVGDLRVFIRESDPSLTFAPKAGMVATLNSDTYQIVSVGQHEGAYELQLRGGGT